MDLSAQLRANLEETVRDGEEVLRNLPQTRTRIIESRLANLRRQLKKKKRERKEIEDSLSALRADFYRRLAALNQNKDRVGTSLFKERSEKLTDDYELHAESFEEEAKALDEDIVAINETISELEQRSALAESLGAVERPAEVDLGSPTRESLFSIPSRLNPFLVRSLVADVRGHYSAPRGRLWALQGEVAFHLGELDDAERYWRAALGESVIRGAARRAVLTNLAHVPYARGDFVAAYKAYAKVIEGRPSSDLSPHEAYTMAVLSYLNGLVDEARVYLTHADAEGRERMKDVLSLDSTGSTDPADATDSMDPSLKV